MTRLPYRFAALLLALAVASSARADSPPTDRPLRAGIIGLDTSHVIAFTKTLNDPKASGELAGVRVVAAFPGGSADFPPSRDRVERFTQQVRDMGVEIVDSIPALLQKVDVVLLESVDGRPHLEQVRPVFAAGKPVFIDKPLAGSLADAIAIEELGRQHKAIWFSTSSLRFYPGIAAMRENEKVGKVTGCDAWGPCEIQPTHPDLYWYGIHGVETLYAIMGPGCQTVSRTHTDHTDEVVGVWKDGRVGTFRGIRPPGKGEYGATVYGTKGVVAADTKAGGYDPLVREIVKFFKTRRPPVASAETVEVMAFMEAADESKRQGGRPVRIEDVMSKAREQAKSRAAGR
jgi:predicted dehydrogenase